MKNSKISWTDHTFSPWWGCMKISEGCKNCYAETLDNRYHKQNPHWGPDSSRKMQSENYWKQPLKWNSAAAHANVQAKVFCASMADVFEGHSDTLPHIERLFRLINNTPWLIWQLLTKRPENSMQLVPDTWQKQFPSNVWLGTSIENQKAADERIPYLLQVPASVRFLSCEPLLSHLNLHGDFTDHTGEETKWLNMIDWVICGGESGHGARPMETQWAMSLMKQCEAAGVSFFMKQGSKANWPDYKDFNSFPVELQKREFPKTEKACSTNTWAIN